MFDFTVVVVVNVSSLVNCNVLDVVGDISVVEFSICDFSFVAFPNRERLFNTVFAPFDKKCPVKNFWTWRSSFRRHSLVYSSSYCSIIIHVLLYSYHAALPFVLLVDANEKDMIQISLPLILNGWNDIFIFKRTLFHNSNSVAKVSIITTNPAIANINSP